jgi:hypothetical protein
MLGFYEWVKDNLIPERVWQEHPRKRGFRFPSQNPSSGSGKAHLFGRREWLDKTLLAFAVRNPDDMGLGVNDDTFAAGRSDIAE